MIPTYDDITKEPTFLSSSFDEPVLYAPARIERIRPCDTLKIVTAFTDCERISTHMISLAEGMKNNRFIKRQKVDIILGMTKSSLSAKKHEDICRLVRFINGTREMPSLSCRYIANGQEVHSKVYIWGQSQADKTEIPSCAYCGSLNYTMNAFYKRRETISLCDPISAYRYYTGLIPDTIDCFDPSAPQKLKNVANKGAEAAEDPDNSEREYLYYDSQKPIAVIQVSLLRADGSDTGYGSGINWGIRPNGTRRNKNQAYIPYNHQDKVKGFFPEKVNPDDNSYPIFRVITKDFGSFHMRMAQEDGKALHSVESNAILGEWIRKRIGVPDGGYITKQMLDLYGKTYVVFRKYADGVYLLDF